jgi:hypothetical protein
LFRVRLEGGLTQTDEPTLFAANHPSVMDSLLLPLFLGRHTVVLLPREDLRSVWLRLALRFVAHRVADVNDPATIRKVMRLLAAGKSVVLYPEARVFDAPSVMKVYQVPALIAVKTGAPVVAVRIRYRRGWLPRAVVRVHAPVRVYAAAQATSRARRARATDLVAANDPDRRRRRAAHAVQAFLDTVREQAAHPHHRGHEGGAALQDLLKGRSSSAAGLRAIARRARTWACRCRT